MLKKTIFILALTASLGFQAALAAPAEDWTGVVPGNTGTYADTKGSKITFTLVDGAKTGEKALKVESHLLSGGWCGIWHNVSLDLSKDNALKFMAKADAPCQVNFSLTDANKMQYGASVSISSKDWAEVTLPFSSLEKNKYYVPDGAVTNKAMDLSKVPGMGLSPSAPGDSTVWIGALSPVEGAVQAAAPAASAAPANLKGVTVVLQDFDVEDATTYGPWKDDKGSKIEITHQAAKKKDNADDKMIVIHYNMIEGGWCGVWHRAGDDASWGGVDLSGGKLIVLKVFTSKPMEIGVSLEDLNKLKFDGASNTTTGGKWETVTIPMDGLSKDFSLVKTFNMYMKTPGDNTLSIDQITVVK